jgi:hypothetical protein
VEFFSGRVWWGGVGTSKLLNRVYFTQTLESDEQIGKCYQEADPTAEHISDVVATDGGTIDILEMGNLLKMFNLGKSLVLFADNGVWQIGPGEDAFFNATSFEVRKISNLSVLSADAVVGVEGRPVFWAREGIYLLTEDKISGFLTAQSLTRESIQGLYNDISIEDRARATATYDFVERKVYWGYKDDDSDTTNVYKKNKALVYDVDDGAFFTQDYGRVNDSSAPLAVDFLYSVEHSKLKVLGVEENQTAVDSEKNWKPMFYEFNEPSWHDWKSFDGTGVDAAAYLVSAYETGGDASRDKQTPFITFLFRQTETAYDANNDTFTDPSSCKMVARWDWTDAVGSKKWNPERQVYKVRPLQQVEYSDKFKGFPVTWSRNKVRGRGRAIHFRLETEEGKDLKILGWQIAATGVTET